ncbi:MAG: hypothetical protein CM15mP49_11910 [Actinomycetota bacterium]|nr:MAG: hypothetical protein CM15mP49_11910 [Actinomycetota bacterium]
MAGKPLIDREHFGSLIIYTSDGSMPDQVVQAVRKRRPELDPRQIIVQGHQGLEKRIKNSLTLVRANSFLFRTLNQTTGQRN